MAASTFREVCSPNPIAVVWVAPAPADASLATTLCDLVRPSPLRPSHLRDVLERWTPDAAPSQDAAA